MNYSFRRLLFLLLIVNFFSIAVFAQSKSDKKIIKRLKADIEYLASDELEGRRTATEGEKKAAAFIESRYKKEKILPYKGNYAHPFNFVNGKEVSSATVVKIDEHVLKLNDDYFPLPFSGNTSIALHSEVLPDVFEQGNIWLIGLYNEKEDATDPHFDFEKKMYDRAKTAKKQGASAVVFYDNEHAKYPPAFNTHSDFEALDIPVAFVTYEAFESFIKNSEAGVAVDMNIALKKAEFTGTNVAAYIDNKALYTVVIGAHYDHLGYGEDGNALDYKVVKEEEDVNRKDKRIDRIHNGADDNASGTAGLLEIATKVKKSRLRNYNYLFVHFSGEELGLFGSKAFVKDEGIDSSKIAYMINMDMVGRLNDSTHALTVGGVGTSPVWGQFISKDNKDFKIVVDSSGVGPSDHTSFYHAGIPVLFFFTGIHRDYHKVTDDANKINYTGEVQVLKYIYSIIDVVDTRPKPLFTPTKQTAIGKVKFKVTLGIMPDYSYSEENGVRVDDVSEGRPASKAGLKAGDIITQLGANKVKGMQSYMEALSKFKEGDKTEVTVLRNGKPMKFKLTFK